MTLNDACGVTREHRRKCAPKFREHDVASPLACKILRRGVYSRSTVHFRARAFFFLFAPSSFFHFRARITSDSSPRADMQRAWQQAVPRVTAVKRKVRIPNDPRVKFLPSISSSAITGHAVRCAPREIFTRVWRQVRETTGVRNVVLQIRILLCLDSPEKLIAYNFFLSLRKNHFFLSFFLKKNNFAVCCDSRYRLRYLCPRPLGKIVSEISEFNVMVITIVYRYFLLP